MTDKKFQTLINKLAKANLEYKELLEQAEQEIFDRYGYYPSDIDFDEWIDVFHIGKGTMTINEIDKGIKECIPD